MQGDSTLSKQFVQSLKLSMIFNKLCPYCSITMIKAENLDNSRSVEHLVPNSVLREKRKNDQGDFYACRKCNSRKSHIDNLLAIISKSQSSDPDLAIETLTHAISQVGKSSNRFIEMIAHAKEGPFETTMNIPILGRELLEYIEFLGKGQYFKKNLHLYNSKKLVMLVEYINKPVLDALEYSYQKSHGTNPFRDLESNLYSEVIGDCIIYSKNNKFLFIFHDVTSIIIKIKNRNPKNIIRSNIKNNYILKNFK